MKAVTVCYSFVEQGAVLLVERTREDDTILITVADIVRTHEAPHLRWRHPIRPVDPTVRSAAAHQAAVALWIHSTPPSWATRKIQEVLELFV